jgi:hypothetical protein
MKRQYAWKASVGLCWMVTVNWPSAYAIERGSTGAGIAYVSGGVGQSELVALNEEKKNYSFWLTTAAKGSGSYLAAVRVRIVTAGTRLPVLEHTMDGPWLFAALPKGSYEVEASYTERPGSPLQTTRKTTTIHPGDHHQMVLYFDSNDAVDKGSEPAFKASPYSGK